MNLFDDENEIISYFQEVENCDVYFPVKSLSAVSFFKRIHNKDLWKNWTDSSNKSAPPPDYYSDKYCSMMEIMRIDDHAHKNKKGKIVNPTNIRESEIQREIREQLGEKNCEHMKILVNAVTRLPTFEDHNYKFYLDNFTRTLNHHKEKISLYRKNHPNFKLAFFVLDESSMYISVTTEAIAKKGARCGEPIFGSFHYHFIDENFLNVIKDLDVDYLIWYTPYKYVDTLENVPQVPRVVVFDMKRYDFTNMIKYDLKLMMSSEE